MPGRVIGGLAAVMSPKLLKGTSGTGLSRYQNDTGDGTVVAMLSQRVGD